MFLRPMHVVAYISSSSFFFFYQMAFHWMNVLNSVYLYTSGLIYLGFLSFSYYEYSSYEQPHTCLFVDMYALLLSFPLG